MKVIIYDMSDDPHARPQIILRLVDDDGCLRVQSPIYGTEDFARNLGEVLAGAFGTDLVWLGPSPGDTGGQILRQAMLEQLVPDERVADGLRQRALF